jgi:hypothetical protein
MIRKFLKTFYGCFLLSTFKVCIFNSNIVFHQFLNVPMNQIFSRFTMLFKKSNTIFNIYKKRGCYSGKLT